MSKLIILVSFSLLIAVANSAACDASKTTCSSCTTAGGTTCDVCAATYYLSSGNCITAAACYASANGKYPNTDGSGVTTCADCPATCNAAQGSCYNSGTSSKCFLCNSATPYIQADQAACVASCGTGEYANNANSLQKSCTAASGDCNAATANYDATNGNCLVCDTNTWYLKTDQWGSKTCYDYVTAGNTCGTGYTADTTNKKCTYTTSASSVSSVAATDASFASKPNVVINAGVNTTDNTNWAVSSARFGAGATSGTLYVYAVKTTTANGVSSISGVQSRSINATIVSNGTDSAENSVITSGAANAVSGWPTPTGSYSLFAVTGYAVIVYNGWETQYTNNLYAYTWAGGATAASASKVQLTAIANPADSGTNKYVYSYAPAGAWLEDGYVYVTFTQWKTTYAVNTNPPVTLLGTNGGSAVLQAAYFQAFNVTSGAFLFNDTAGKSAPKAIVSSLDTIVVDLALTCGPSNYTNSTTVNCLYQSGTDSSKYTVNYITVARSTGTAGSSATVATASIAAVADRKSGTVDIYYAPAGIITGAYASGGLVSQRNRTWTASLLSADTTSTYSLWQYNTTGTATFFNTAITTSATGDFMAQGGTFGQGYFIQASAKTSASSATTNTYTYWLAPYFANGTLNTTVSTVLALQVQNAQFFGDTTGSLWAGYYSVETNAASSATPAVGYYNLYSAYLGKVIGGLYQTGSFGSVLSSFFAFLSLVLLALFAF